MNTAQVMPAEEFRQVQPWGQPESSEKMQAGAGRETWPALNLDEEEEGFIRSSN